MSYLIVSGFLLITALVIACLLGLAEQQLTKVEQEDQEYIELLAELDKKDLRISYDENESEI